MAVKKREFRNLRQGGQTVGQYVEDFSKLARYAPDDVATDAAKQEKFLEGLNDELSMQLMVATFNNYQELVDRALMIEGKQQQIENRKRKYGQGKHTSELNRSHILPLDCEDIFSIPMEEVARTIIMAPRMVMGMEKATARTAPTHQPQPR